MKLKHLTPALVALLGLALSSPLVTVRADDSSAPAAADTSADTTFHGKVTATDASSFTIKDKNGSDTIAVDSSTTFKGASALSDIAVGDHVSGTYTKDSSGKMTATLVKKSKPKKKKPASSDAGSDAGGGQ